MWPYSDVLSVNPKYSDCLHPANASSPITLPIVSTELGSITTDRLGIAAKLNPSSTLTPFVNATFSIELHPKKAPYPTYSTPEGILIVFNP